MSAPAFHTAAARDAGQVVVHARATSAAAAHGLELIDEVLAAGGWKADLIGWVRAR